MAKKNKQQRIVSLMLGALGVTIILSCALWVFGSFQFEEREEESIAHKTSTIDLYALLTLREKELAEAKLVIEDLEEIIVSLQEDRLHLLQNEKRAQEFIKQKELIINNSTSASQQLNDQLISSRQKIVDLKKKLEVAQREKKTQQEKKRLLKHLVEETESSLAISREEQEELNNRMIVLEDEKRKLLHDLEERATKEKDLNQEIELLSRELDASTLDDVDHESPKSNDSPGVFTGE